MSQLAIAIELARVDVRWRFLKILYGVFAVAGLVLIKLSFQSTVSTRPQLVAFEVFLITTLFAHLINIPRIGFPYQLGLPISPRTFFLTTLLLSVFAIWIPAALLTVFLLASGHHRLTVPLLLVGSWMAASSSLWLVWPKRQSPPIASRAFVFLVHMSFLIWWLLHRIPQQAAATLFLISAAAVLIVFLRLPSAFTLDWLNEQSPALLKLSANSNPWFAIVRILFPPTTLLLFVSGLFQQGGRWPMQGFYIFIFYATIRSGDPLLLSLPLSDLQLVYARLVCAFLLETLLASYVDLIGRLGRTHSGPHLGPTLLSFPVALVLVAAMKSLWWRRTPRWAKRPMLALLCLLFIGTIVLTFVGNMMNRMADLTPWVVVPSTLFISVLLVGLITVQTRNSDRFGMSVTSSPGSSVLTRG